MLLPLLVRMFLLSSATLLPAEESSPPPVVVLAEVSTQVFHLGEEGVRPLDVGDAIANPAERLRGPGELLLICQGASADAPGFVHTADELLCRGDLRLVGLDFSARATEVECTRTVDGDWRVRLRGTGTESAELWQASLTGGRPLHIAARAIHYAPALRRVELGEASFLASELPVEAQWKLQRQGW